MAMSETMSGPNDWLQFYHQSFPPQPPPTSAPDSTTVAAAVSTAATPATHLSPEGRVSKPIRRRSRASRRTPTTLLNTDTTNFRAMVQQFTGGPSAPFAPSAPGLPNLGLGFGSGPVPVNSTALMVAPPGSGFHLQQQQQQLYQQQNQQFIYSSTTQGGDNTFFQRLISNPRPPNATDQGGFLMDHGGRFFPSTSS